MSGDMAETIVIGTDGGAMGNGTANCIASYAAIIRRGDSTTVKSGIITLRATNNVGELTAILAAVEHVADVTGANIRIISDSDYSIKSIETWYHNWVKTNKLMTKKNTDLIGKIVAAVAALRVNNVVTFSHIRSHKINDGTLEWELNDLADKECQRILAVPRTTPHVAEDNSKSK